MIKKFNSFYNESILSTYDEDEWEEVEDEEYEFASPGSVLYTFSLLRDGEIDVSERVADLYPRNIYNIPKEERVQKVYFYPVEFDRFEDKMFIRDGGYRCNLNSEFTYIFNASGVDDVKKDVKEHVKGIIVQKKRDIEYVQKRIDDNQTKINQLTKIRESLNEFDIYTFIDNIDVGNDEYVQVQFINKDGITSVINKYTQEEINYYATNSRFKDKSRLAWSKWDIAGFGGGFLEKMNDEIFYKNHKSHWWTREYNSMFTVLFKGDKKEEVKKKLRRTYPAQKGKYNRLQKDFNYTGATDKTRISQLQKGIKNIENLNVDKYL